jgi:pyruvate formate lyase activating enzyme
METDLCTLYMQENKYSIFDIKRFSVHDGPGIRTTLFFKGCPLKCIWCANPESQSVEPELAYFSNKCKLCGRCIAVCPYGARTIDNGKLLFDREKCAFCGKCASICPEGAIQIIKGDMATSKVREIILADRIFFQNSNGGVTLSGGEPLAYVNIEQSKEILFFCKEQLIHTAVETCGYVPFKNFKEVVPLINLLLFDIKIVDSIKHEEYTGVENSLILENLKKISTNDVEVIIRVPLIPGYNDHKSDIQDILNIARKSEIATIELILYHNLGINKYKALGRMYSLSENIKVDKRKVEYFIDEGKKLGIDVSIA